MISIFKEARSKTALRNLDEASFFDAIKNGEWQDTVLEYRRNPTSDNKIKNPCVTASGVFKERKADMIIEHSGLICIDIDAKDQICTIDEDSIRADPYCHVLHRSIGGLGLAMYVKIDGARHLDAYLGLEKYLFVNYSIVIDKACKDTSRLRFISYDPDLFINTKSKIFKQYLPKKETKKVPKQVFVKSDFDEMVNQASRLNLFEDYKDYIELSFALVSEFKSGGRSYFHALCSGSSKYNREQADKHYDIALRRSGTGITIKSVYFKFKEAGISLISERTKEIKQIALLSDAPKKELEIRGIQDEENLIEKFNEAKQNKETELDLVISLIKMSKIKFNEISRNFEFDGVEMTDRILAEFYTKVWSKIDENVSKDKIFTLIQSRKITPSYNPVHEWFDKHAHISTDNEFDKLKECFDITAEMMHEGKLMPITDYLDVFLKKWLLGIIGSAYGTYSLMILVMIGEQGTEKTKFFRNLLPEGLRKFYAESNLDEGKDSEILMTKKLLIIDDEFGGKSKKDATKLKRLSSQQTFSIRMPYGRVSEDLTRLAVLGGTSNENEVINDPTGNRRIIPINLNGFNFAKYDKIDKNKLFVELYNEWKSDKEAWFLTKQEIYFLNESTRNNTETMAEIELINKYLVPDLEGSMTNTDIKLALESTHLSFKTTSKRIGQALKLCGFECFIGRVDGKIKRFYKATVVKYEIS